MHYDTVYADTYRYIAIIKKTTHIDIHSLNAVYSSVTRFVLKHIDIKLVQYTYVYTDTYDNHLYLFLMVHEPYFISTQILSYRLVCSQKTITYRCKKIKCHRGRSGRE